MRDMGVWGERGRDTNYSRVARRPILVEYVGRKDADEETERVFANLYR